jgi:hypothetical protein
VNFSIVYGVCVAGIGHPLTSGGLAIDYSLLSSRTLYSSPSRDLITDPRASGRGGGEDGGGSGVLSIALACAAGTEGLTGGDNVFTSMLVLVNFRWYLVYV